MLPVKMNAQQSENKFSRISVNEGLSQNTINCMMQDQNGFVWVGTKDGLNRFDGYKFKVYQHEIGNKNSLSDNNIRVIFQDSNQFLWIGTDVGLNKLDMSTNQITRFQHDKKDVSTISHSRITTINEDANGIIWVGTKRGLNRFDAKENTFRRYFSDALDPKSISHNFIVQIIFTEEKQMLVATRNGLNSFDEKTEAFKNFKFNTTESKLRKPNNTIYNFVKGIDNGFWLGTATGLYHFNYKTKIFTNYQHDIKSKNSLSDNFILSIFMDKRATLWVSTPKGVNKFNKETNTFMRYNSNTPENQIYKNVTCFMQDQSENMWVGTYNAGAVKIYSEYNKFTHIKTPSHLSKNSIRNNIWAFQEDKNGNLWYGTSNGVYVYNIKKEQFLQLKQNIKEKQFGPLSNGIQCLHFDTYNNLWIGTKKGVSRLNASYVNSIWNGNDNIEYVHFNGSNKLGIATSTFYEDENTNVLWIGSNLNGLFKLQGIDKNDEEIKNIEITNYAHNSGDETSITNNWVTAITRDKKGNLWVCTDGGLNKMNEGSETFERFPNSENSRNYSKARISSIHVSNENLWMGTHGDGLLKFNLNEKKIDYYTSKNGLPNNTVYGVLLGNDGKLWMSTDHGLSRFNIQTQEFKNYIDEDGLQNNEFNTGAFYKNTDGKLYFGGVNGFNVFSPESIAYNKIKPTILFTNFEVLNVKVQPRLTNKELGISNDNKILLRKDIIATDTIHLSYKHQIFSVEFAALHFQAPTKNQYAHQLEGFDTQWVYSTADNRRVTYTNLKPNTYTLKVKGANSDGVWNEEAKSIVIIVAPPFWNTWWFYAICLLSVFMIITAIFKTRLNQQLLIRRNEEKNAMLKEIHHRVKNNLQVVNSLLRLQSSKIEDQSIVTMFEEAQKRVLSMALLHEKMYNTDNLKDINVSSHIKLLVEDLVESYAVDKNIKLDIEIEDIKIGMNTLVPLGLIISEIISNALKYAFVEVKDGTIKIAIRQLNDKQYEMIIGDSGVGLKKGEKNLGLGTQLIQIFTKQLNGKLEQLDFKGTFYQLLFESIDD